LDADVAGRINSLAVEAEAILTEFQRARSSREPSKAGIGLFATFVVPPGYKRLARQVGSQWVDSSVEAQVRRLEDIEREWRLRVLGYLRTIEAQASPGRRSMSSEAIQAGFERIRRYQRVGSRLTKEVSFLKDLTSRNLVPGPPGERSVQPSVRRSTRSVLVEREAAPGFFPPTVVAKLPQSVRKSIEQAAECYGRGLYEPCAIMLRKALQNAIVLRFESEGVGDQVLRSNGDALPLPQLLEKAQESRLISSQQAKELLKVKWLGDTAAHSYANAVVREDVDGILLMIRLALERIFTIEIRILKGG